MSHKTLSICIPTYNRASILNNTLSNIVAQEISEVEVIVSDNASTDDTYEVVKKYEPFGIKYFSNSNNQGLTYNLIKVMEYATSDYLTLLSDEDDINIASIIESIDGVLPNKVAAILGTIRTADNDIYRGYRTKIGSKKFRTFYSFGFSVAYMSGIVFRNRIDLNDLWREFNSSSSHGLLDIYPHVYLFNRLLLKNDIATDSRTFVRFREKGVDYADRLNNIGYYHPSARYEQLKKNLLFLKMYSSFDFVESRLLTNKLLELFKTSALMYKEFDEEIKDYYSIEYTDDIDFEIFFKNSFRELIETKQIMIYDKWLLNWSIIVRYLYSILKKVYIKSKLILSKIKL